MFLQKPRAGNPRAVRSTLKQELIKDSTLLKCLKERFERGEASPDLFLTSMLKNSGETVMKKYKMVGSRLKLATMNSGHSSSARKNSKKKTIGRLVKLPELS